MKTKKELAKRILSSKDANRMMEEFIFLLNNRLITAVGIEDKLEDQNRSLLEVCLKLSDPRIIQAMFNCHPLWQMFDSTESNVLINQFADIYNNIQTFTPQTADEFIKGLNTNPAFIPDAKAQLTAKNKTFFDFCSQISDPQVVKNMFMNDALMREIEREGKKEVLIQKHAAIYERMWPDYSKAPSIKDNSENETYARSGPRS